VNSISIIGRPTRDPQLHFTNNGTAVAQLRVAFDQAVSEQTRYLDVEAWGATPGRSATIAGWAAKSP
jgi:single-stranded DNA-binding protein